MEAGLAQIGLIRRDFPSIKLVALTTSLSFAKFLQAMRAGVDAILTNDISSGVLQASIELVLQSQQILLTPMGHMVAEAMLNPKAGFTAGESGGGRDEKRSAEEASNLVPFTLSERESQILRCLVKGFSNKAIARELELAETTEGARQGIDAEAARPTGRRWRSGP